MTVAMSQCWAEFRKSFRVPTVAAVAAVTVVVTSPSTAVAEEISGTVVTYAGATTSNDERAANWSDLDSEFVIGIATDSQGQVYFASGEKAGSDASATIYRKSGDKDPVPIVEDGAETPSHDGVSANDTTLGSVIDIAVGPDDSLYLVDGRTDSVRKIGSDGVITTVAGGGETPPGDGAMAAVDAKFESLEHVAVGEDGSLYVVDRPERMIYKVSPGGELSKLAGGDGDEVVPDGGLATSGSVGQVNGLAVDAKNNVYIAASPPDDERTSNIRVIEPDGVVETVAEGHNCPGSDESYNGLEEQFCSVDNIDAGPDGSIYVADRGSRAIAVVQRSGRVDELAGEFVAPTQVAVLPDGDVLYAEAVAAGDSKIRIQQFVFNDTETSKPSSATKQDKPATGIPWTILGIAAGVVILAAAAVCVFWLRRKRNRDNSALTD